jgi:hypothetical protein
MARTSFRPFKGWLPSSAPERASAGPSKKIFDLYGDTWVFRRTADSDWELVHRHADALVHAIDHERLGVLARGE